MPAKRKSAEASGSSAQAEPQERRSRLAKEHSITAREEREIKEAFSLFAEPAKGHKEGLIPTSDVQRAMIALNLAPSSGAELSEYVSILDPEDEGLVEYEPFVAICALKLHARDAGGDAAEVDEAFRLFAGEGGGSSSFLGDSSDVLTLGTLKRVAGALKQDVDEQLLKDMILEANGGAGVTKGVNRAEFEEVMRRAGAWK